MYKKKGRNKKEQRNVNLNEGHTEQKERKKRIKNFLMKEYSTKVVVVVIVVVVFLSIRWSYSFKERHKDIET